MTASTFVPQNRQGWWGTQDQRVRCSADGKVVKTQDGALRSAQAATDRGTPMHAYLGRCGHWHTSKTRR